VALALLIARQTSIPFLHRFYSMCKAEKVWRLQDRKLESGPVVMSQP